MKSVNTSIVLSVYEVGVKTENKLIYSKIVFLEILKVRLIIFFPMTEVIFILS